MRARDVMTTKVFTVDIDATVDKVAAMLAENRISGVPVVDSAGHVLGIVSEGDLFRRAETGTEKRRSWWLEFFADPSTQAREFLKQQGARAEHVMTRRVVSVGEDAPLERLADLMELHGVKRLPVVREGKLVGIVSRADLVRALATAPPRAGGGPRDDRSIDAALHAKLRTLPWLNAAYLNVVVEGGTVSLYGFVDSTDQRRALKAMAEGVAGVRRVDDRLSERPRAAGFA